jgi:hypothetical protein
MYNLCKHSIKAHACPAPECKIFVFHMTAATLLQQNSSYVSCMLWFKINVLKVIKKKFHAINHNTLYLLQLNIHGSIYLSHTVFLGQFVCQENSELKTF